MPPGRYLSARAERVGRRRHGPADRQHSRGARVAPTAAHRHGSRWRAPPRRLGAAAMTALGFDPWAALKSAKQGYPPPNPPKTPNPTPVSRPVHTTLAPQVRPPARGL